MPSSASNLSKFFNKEKIQKSSDEEIINLILELWNTVASEKETGHLPGDELLPFIIAQFNDIDLLNIFLLKKRLDDLFENNGELYYSLEGDEQYIYITLLSAFCSLTADYRPPTTQNKHAFFTPAKKVGIGASVVGLGLAGAGTVAGVSFATGTSLMGFHAALTATAMTIAGATISTGGLALMIGLAVLGAIGVGLMIKGVCDQKSKESQKEDINSDWFEVPGH